MAKVVIIYGSTTGNTETLSKSVENGIKSSGLDVLVRDVSDVNPEELKNYGGIVLGCSTWGDGELQDDFIPFEEKMRALRLDGKKAAVFGPGDSDYSLFCEAVDILEKRLKDCGAEIIINSLKIDEDEDADGKKSEEWGTQIGQMLVKLELN